LLSSEVKFPRADLGSSLFFIGDADDQIALKVTMTRATEETGQIAWPSRNAQAVNQVWRI